MGSLDQYLAQTPDSTSLLSGKGIFDSSNSSSHMLETWTQFPALGFGMAQTDQNSFHLFHSLSFCIINKLITISYVIQYAADELT